jgi:hypothetical protein
MMDDAIALKKWMITACVAVATMAFGSAMWISRIDHQVEAVAVDIPDIQTDVAVALQVLADHGSELQAIRDSQLQTRAVVDNIQAEITTRTADRYYRTDAEREWRFHREREHVYEAGRRPERVSP